ncbi:MAG: hypothetical protein AB1641_09190 [Thermodesulfobacteriota bacterium]
MTRLIFILVLSFLLALPAGAESPSAGSTGPKMRGGVRLKIQTPVQSEYSQQTTITTHGNITVETYQPGCQAPCPGGQPYPYGYTIPCPGCDPRYFVPKSPNQTK